MARMSFSKRDASQLAGKLERAKAQIKRARKKGEEVTDSLVGLAETGTAAFAAGVINGKTGGFDILGVPVELALGGLLNIAGWAGLGGKSSKHLNAIGTGFLAAFATTLGHSVGRGMNEGAAVSGKRLIGRSNAALPPQAADAALVQHARRAAMAG